MPVRLDSSLTRWSREDSVKIEFFGRGDALAQRKTIPANGGYDIAVATEQMRDGNSLADRVPLALTVGLLVQAFVAPRSLLLAI